MVREFTRKRESKDGWRGGNISSIYPEQRVQLCETGSAHRSATLVAVAAERNMVTKLGAVGIGHFAANWCSGHDRRLQAKGPTTMKANPRACSCGGCP